MYWNNRIVRDKLGNLTLREVYYNNEGEISSFTKNPIGPRGDDLEDFLLSLEKIYKDVKDCKESDVIDEANVKFGPMEPI